MQINLLKDIVASVAGDKARSIVDLLVSKKHVNEFLIAKKLNLTINQTRNILYKLADEGLVSFLRKKDSKKGGWYTYFWTLNQDKSLYKFQEMLNKSIENLKQQIQSKKTERFFTCSNCHIDYTEESALLNDYTCSECGEILQLKDSSKEVVVFEKDLGKAEELLKEVQAEIVIIQDKDAKSRTRKMKAVDKKKSVERAAKRKKKQSEMKKITGKVKKKNPGKTGKKKPSRKKK